MLSFFSDRRVLSVSAALITAAIFLFLLGTYPSWRAAIKEGVSWTHNAPTGAQLPPEAPAAMPVPLAPAVPAPNAAPSPSAAAPVSPPPPAVAPAAGKASDAGAPAPGDTAASPAPPTFDIVRVEPTGDSVVAARAQPGAAVVLLDEGRPIARAQADANGQVAFVPPTLAPGEHSLMLSTGEPNTPGALSSQSVAIAVPQAAKAAPMVALIQPDAPTRVLSDGASTPAGTSPQAAPSVTVSAIDVEEMGSVYATGKAAPGSHCRVYLNGSFVAPVTAGPDGTWSLKIEHGMKPGHYAVRVDQVGSSQGSVQARAEVPFDYPANLDRSASLLRPKVGGPIPRVDGAATAQARPFGGTATVAAGQPSDAAVPSTKPALAVPGDQSASGTTQVASAAAPTDAVAMPGSADSAGVPTVVAQLLTTKVVHGDSLWRISRKMLGHGRHYTQIYAANTSQIRDPRLIYPGQIFVMPQAPSP